MRKHCKRIPVKAKQAITLFLTAIMMLGLFSSPFASSFTGSVKAEPETLSVRGAGAVEISAGSADYDKGVTDLSSYAPPSFTFDAGATVGSVFIPANAFPAAGKADALALTRYDDPASLYDPDDFVIDQNGFIGVEYAGEVELNLSELAVPGGYDYRFSRFLVYEFSWEAGSGAHTVTLPPSGFVSRVAADIFDGSDERTGKSSLGSVFLAQSASAAAYRSNGEWGYVCYYTPRPLMMMASGLLPGVENAEGGITLRYVNTAKEEYKSGETITLKLAMVSALFSPENGVSYRVAVDVEDPGGNLEYVGYYSVSYIESVEPVYEGPGGALSDLIVNINSAALTPGTVVEASINLRFKNGYTPDKEKATFTAQMQRKRFEADPAAPSESVDTVWKFWNQPEDGFDEKTVENISAPSWNATLSIAANLTIPDALFENSIIRLKDSISAAQTFTFGATNNKPATGWLYTDELTLKTYIYIPAYVYPESIAPGTESLGTTAPDGSGAPHYDANAANNILLYNEYDDPGDSAPAAFFTKTDFTYPNGEPDSFNFVGTVDVNFGLSSNQFYINTTHANKNIIYYVYELDWVIPNEASYTDTTTGDIGTVTRSVTLGDDWFYVNNDSMLYNSSNTALLSGQAAYFMSRVETSAVPFGPDKTPVPNANKPANSSSTSISYGYVRYTTKRSGTVPNALPENAMKFYKSATAPPVTATTEPVEYLYNDKVSIPKFWLYGINNICDDKAGYASQPLSELFVIDGFKPENEEQDVFDLLAIDTVYTGVYTVGFGTNSAELQANMLRYKDMYMEVSYTNSADPHSPLADWLPIELYNPATSNWSAAILGWQEANTRWNVYSQPLFKPASYGVAPEYIPSGVYSQNTGVNINFADAVPATKAGNTVYVVTTEQERYDITGIKIQYFNPTPGDKGGIPPSFRQNTDATGPYITYKNVGKDNAEGDEEGLLNDRPYPSGTVVNEATLYYNRYFDGDNPEDGMREEITESAGVTYQPPDFITVKGDKSFTTVREDPDTGELIVDEETQEILPDGILEYSLVVTNNTPTAATNHVFTLNQLLLYDQPDPKLKVLPDNTGPFYFDYKVRASNGTVLHQGTVGATWEGPVPPPAYGYPPGSADDRPILVIHFEDLDNSIKFPKGSTVVVNYRLQVPSAQELEDNYGWNADTNPSIALQNKYWWALWYGGGPGKGGWHWQERGGGGGITVNVVPGGIPTVSIQKEITNSPPEGRSYWEVGDLIEFTITAKHTGGKFPDGLLDPYITIADVFNGNFNYNQTRATSPTSALSRVARDAEVWYIPGGSAPDTAIKLGRINRESATISGEEWIGSALTDPFGNPFDKQSRGEGEGLTWLSAPATNGAGVAGALREFMDNEGEGREGYYFLGQTSAKTTLSTNNMAFLLDRDKYFQVGDQIVVKYLVSANASIANATDIENTAYLAFETESAERGTVRLGYNSNVCVGISPTAAPTSRFTVRGLGNNSATVYDLRFFNSSLIVYSRPYVRLYQPAMRVELTKEVISSYYDDLAGKYYFRYLVTIANEATTNSYKTYPYTDPLLIYQTSPLAYGVNNLEEVKWNWSLRDILPPGQTIVMEPGMVGYWVANPTTTTITTYPLRDETTGANALLQNFAYLEPVLDDEGNSCEMVAFRLGGSNLTGRLANAETSATRKLYLYYWTVMDDDAWGEGDEISKPNYVALLPDDANIGAVGPPKGILTNDANYASNFMDSDEEPEDSRWMARNPENSATVGHYIANSAFVNLFREKAALDIIKFNQAAVNPSGNNLGVTKSTYNPEYEPGGFPIFRIAVCNNGRTPATLENGFQIVDQFPDMLEFDDSWDPILTTYNAAEEYAAGVTAPYVYMPEDEYTWDEVNSRLIFTPSVETLESLYKLNYPTGTDNWYEGGTLSYSNNAYASGVAVLFRGKIKTEASGTYVNNAYVFPNKGQDIDPGGIVTGSYAPKGTLNDNAATDDELKFADREGVGSGVPLTVVGVYSLNSWKEVKNLDTGEAATGRYGFEEIVEASGGDTLRYTVNVSSDSTRFTFDDIVVIDQVPYLGDTGVIDTRPRDSKFDMIFPSDPNVEIWINNKNETLNAGITVQYSSKTALELTPDDWAGISEDGWYNEPQEDSKLIRVILPQHTDGTPPTDGMALKPNVTEPSIVDNSLKISFDMLIPQDAPATGIVWNSFGYELLPRSNADATKADRNYGYGNRLKAEPIRVGARIGSIDVSFNKAFLDSFGIGAPYNDVSFLLEEVVYDNDEKGWFRKEEGHSYVFGGNNIPGRNFDLDEHGFGSGVIALGDYVVIESQLTGYYLKEIYTENLSFTLDPLEALDGEDAVGVYLLKLTAWTDTKILINADNDVTPLEFTIYKVDESGNPLFNAAFALYTDESCSPETIVQNSTVFSAPITGNVLFGGLKPQMYYYVKELSPPARYKPNDAVYRFILNTAGEGYLQRRFGADWLDVSNNEVVNDPYSMSYTLRKTGDLLQHTYYLPGAEFAVYTDSALTDKFGTYKSDANGDVAIGGLWVNAGTGIGEFFIQEEYAPSPYERDDTVYKLTVTSAGGAGDIPQFELTKVSDGSMADLPIVNESYRYDFGFLKMGEQKAVGAAPGLYPLGGVEFTLYTDAGCTAEYEGKSSVSTATGQVEFAGVQPGTYYMKETAVPPGYEGGAVYVAEVSESGNVTITLPEADLEAGTRPEPAKNGGGTWELVNLMKRYDFSFIKRFNNISNINVTTATTSPAVYGEAEYGLYYDEMGILPVLDTDGAVMRALSANDGTVTFAGLPPGTYYVIETGVHGYRASTHNVSDDVIKVEINPEGTIEKTIDHATFDFASNPLKYGYCEFRKVDSESGIGVIGAEFDVYQSDEDGVGSEGPSFVTITTVANGWNYLYDEDAVLLGHPEDAVLVAPYYWIKESKAPVGYKLDDTWYRLEKVSVEPGDPYEGVFEWKYDLQMYDDNTGSFISLQNNYINMLKNDPEESPAITFTKLEMNTDIPVEGAIFTLYKSVTCNEEDVFAAATTIADGTASFSGLLYGHTYFLKETGAPDGYALNETVYSVTWLDDGDRVIMSPVKGSAAQADIENRVIRNYHALYDFPVFKAGEGSAVNGLFGATFNLSGDAIDITLTTNSSGVMWFRSVPAGNYTLTELAPLPAGYENAGPWDVTVAVNGDVTITTGGETEGRETYIQGISGEHTLKLTNKIQHFDFSFTKTDVNHNPLSGAVFGLYSNPACTNLNLVQESDKSGMDGIVSFNVKPDTYYMKEILAPPAFRVSDDIFRVVMAPGGDTTIMLMNNSSATGEPSFTGIENNMISNEKIITSLSFRKTDREESRLTGSPAYLEGVEFNLKTGGVQAGGPFTSGLGGWVTLTGLEAGKTYTLVEAEPDGYTLVDAALHGYTGPDVYTVEVSDEGAAVLKRSSGGAESVVTAVENYRNTTKLEFKKESSSGARLSGAEFTLYDDELATITSKRVMPWIAVSTNGVATFNNVPWGTYWMKETKAPNNHTGADSIWKVEIDSELTITITVDGEEVDYDTFTVKNTRKPGGGDSGGGNGGGDEPQVTPVPPPVEPEPEEPEPEEPEPEEPGQEVTTPPVETPQEVTPPQTTQPPGGDDPGMPPVPTMPDNAIVPDGDSWLEIGPDGTPLGVWTWDDELLEWVFDPFPPLAVPKTGKEDALSLPIVSSFIAIGIVALSRRRRRRRV